MLKRFFSAVFLLVFIGSTVAGQSSAMVPDIIDQPLPASQPPIILTTFGGGLPSFFELYNQSTNPIYVGGWNISFSVQSVDGTQLEDFKIVLPNGWLLSKQYLTLQHGISASPEVVGYEVQSAITEPKLTEVSLYDNNHSLQYLIKPSPTIAANQWAQHKQRANASQKMSGVFATDYKINTIDTSVALPKNTPSVYADALYTPPTHQAGLQIVEVLPNARNCSPAERSTDCGDYVKLYNAGLQPIDLSAYRLRSDSGGIKSSATNTFTLYGVLNPGAYYTVTLRDSGEPMSLTNTGGYVWIQDIYGIKDYDATIATYPDSSAASKRGMSWALDAIDNTWKWMLPAPNTANYWPPEGSGEGADTKTGAGLVDCGSGRERNPETNRCRNIVTAASATLTPCKAGQERNPETNRCRSVASASTTLKPCTANQYRNPETNRCKNIASATNTLVPCKEGQERNPETNRCRKTTLSAKNLPAIKDVETNVKASTKGWWFAGAAVLAAFGYGIYEWRHDITQRIQRLARR